MPSPTNQIKRSTDLINKPFLLFVFFLLLICLAYFQTASMLAAPYRQVGLDKGWDTGFGLPQVNHWVYAVERVGDDIYLGGVFDSLASSRISDYVYPVNHIARWDGVRWHRLGDGLDDSVHMIEQVGTDLYVGGEFRTAGDQLSPGFARWDGAAWHAVAQLAPDGSQVTAVVEWNDKLYIGGDFESVDGVQAGQIAVWDGNTWQGLGTGLGAIDDIYALHVHNNQLIVGGEFEEIGGVVTSGLAVWDGSRWSTLGDEGLGFSSRFAGEVTSIATFNGDLIVGGEFEQAAGQTMNSLARWTGSAWVPLGNGVSRPTFGEGKVLDLLSTADGLYVMGDFESAGTVLANNIAKWDGTSWRALGDGLTETGGGEVHAADVAADGSLFVGGEFEQSGTLFLENIARWDGQMWQGLGFGIDTGITSAVAANEQGQVFVGGLFDRVAEYPAENFAMWDGQTWRLPGDIDGHVKAIVVDGADVYIGGSFSRAGGIAVANVVRYNVTRDEWSALGSGINGPVDTLLLHQGRLYAGGYFSAAGLTDAQNIAYWDGGAWQKLGNKTVEFFTSNQTRIRALAAEGDEIYMGGTFSAITINGVPNTDVNSFVFWDQARDEWYYFSGGFTQLGSTNEIQGDLYTIAKSANYLYVGGAFDKAVGKSIAGIARYNLDTLNWEPLQSGIGAGSNTPLAPQARTFLLLGDDLYVGGRFSSAGNVVTENVARWDETSGAWSGLEAGLFVDGGLVDGVLGLAQTGNSLYAVGDQVHLAGDYPSYLIARWVLTDIPNPIGTATLPPPVFTPSAFMWLPYLSTVD